jgi:hypothetical protein
LFRGETFFDCAVRKIRDETGNKNAKVVPLGVIDVWNTFFPNSSWDAERSPGKEGTQTVNITVACLLNEDDELLLGDSALTDWAVERQQWISPADAIVPGAYDKYVSLNVKKAMQLGYLL